MISRELQQKLTKLVVNWKQYKIIVAVITLPTWLVGNSDSATVGEIEFDYRKYHPVKSKIYMDKT